jgi:DNA-binding transcriptional ArsR family regulator
MADVLVAGIAGLVVLLGVVWAVLAAQQPTSRMSGSMGSMMDGGMGGYGTDPLVYLLGGVVLAGAIGVGYLLVREQVSTPEGPANGVGEGDDPGTSGDAVSEVPPGEQASREDGSATERELVRYLPEDERRVLEPVLDSPGITQIEIRDRSDFSKSKVSQTLSELEKRGLVAKEKQGRTFRVYPGEELDDAESA